MPHYRLAAQNLSFLVPIAELEPFATSGGMEEKNMFAPSSFSESERQQLISRAEGWIGGAQHIIEVYDTARGTLLKVESCGEFFIAPHGELISKSGFQSDLLNQLDREILLGPVIVLALALRNIWSLHASAAIYNQNALVFLGESGMGKSTLAAYLSQNAGWQYMTDDILPVKYESGLQLLPRFPQLKLPLDKQPGIDLPEQLSLKTLCVLEHAETDQMPELQTFSTVQTVQALLAHTAGTRMFSAELLAKHLRFSAQAAAQVTAYKLMYPHRREALPIIKELLEQIC